MCPTLPSTFVRNVSPLEQVDILVVVVVVVAILSVVVDVDVYACMGPHCTPGNRRQISPGRLNACLRCLSSVPINIKPHSTNEARPTAVGRCVHRYNRRVYTYAAEFTYIKRVCTPPLHLSLTDQLSHTNELVTGLVACVFVKTIAHTG